MIQLALRGIFPLPRKPVGLILCSRGNQIFSFSVGKRVSRRKTTKIDGYLGNHLTFRVHGRHHGLGHEPVRQRDSMVLRLARGYRDQLGNGDLLYAGLCRSPGSTLLFLIVVLYIR